MFPKVILLAEASSYSIELVNKLLKSNCEVIISSSKPSSWKNVFPEEKKVNVEVPGPVAGKGQVVPVRRNDGIQVPAIPGGNRNGIALGRRAGNEKHCQL